MLTTVTDETIIETFIDAARNGNLEVVNDMLANGIDPNILPHYGKTALFCASFNGHLEVVKSLLNIKNEDRSSADPDFANTLQGNYPIRYAIENEHMEIAQLLLDASIKKLGLSFEEIFHQDMVISSTRLPESIKYFIDRCKFRTIYNEVPAFHILAKWRFKIVKSLTDDLREILTYSRPRSLVSRFAFLYGKAIFFGDVDFANEVKDFFESIHEQHLYSSEFFIGLAIALNHLDAENPLLPIGNYNIQQNKQLLMGYITLGKTIPRTSIINNLHHEGKLTQEMLLYLLELESYGKVSQQVFLYCTLLHHDFDANKSLQYIDTLFAKLVSTYTEEELDMDAKLIKQLHYVRRKIQNLFEVANDLPSLLDPDADTDLSEENWTSELAQLIEPSSALPKNLQLYCIPNDKLINLYSSLRNLLPTQFNAKVYNAVSDELQQYAAELNIFEINTPDTSSYYARIISFLTRCGHTPKDKIISYLNLFSETGNNFEPTQLLHAVLRVNSYDIKSSGEMILNLCLHFFMQEATPQAADKIIALKACESELRMLKNFLDKNLLSYAILDTEDSDADADADAAKAEVKARENCQLMREILFLKRGSLSSPSDELQLPEVIRSIIFEKLLRDIVNKDAAHDLLQNFIAHLPNEVIHMIKDNYSKHVICAVEKLQEEKRNINQGGKGGQALLAEPALNADQPPKSSSSLFSVASFFQKNRRSIIGLGISATLLLGTTPGRTLLSALCSLASFSSPLDESVNPSFLHGPKS